MPTVAQKYRAWLQRPAPKQLPDGFVKVAVLFSRKELEEMAHRRAFTGEGTYSAVVRERMGLRETPHGLQKAVAEMMDAEGPEDDEDHAEE